MNQLYVLVSNRIFLSGLFGWLIAQIAKMTIDYLKGRTHSSGDVISTLLWKTGGMPSSHSALVTSLATSIAVFHGVSSTFFILALFFGGVVIRDALGVRRSSGQQAQVLNQLGRRLSEQELITFNPVKEVSGHTLPEVTVGMVIGLLVALLFSLY